MLPNWTVPGPEFFIYLLHYGTWTQAGLTLLIIWLFKTSGTKKTQIKTILIGLFIALLGAWTTFLPGWGIAVEPYGIHFIFIFQLMIAYTITKHEFLDIRVLIARKDSKIITGILVFLSFLVLYFFNIFQETQWIMLEFSGLGLFWYLLGEKIQLLIQTPLETKFLKGFYNVEKVVQTISQGLFIANSRDEVIRVVTSEFANTIQIKNVITVLAYENELSHRLEY
ncbi:MAG: hypothetical protein AB7F43_15290, partial [Bacteriovoracia bacterium]